MVPKQDTQQMFFFPEIYHDKMRIACQSLSHEAFFRVRPWLRLKATLAPRRTCRSQWWQHKICPWCRSMWRFSWTTNFINFKLLSISSGSLAHGLWAIPIALSGPIMALWSFVKFGRPSWKSNPPIQSSKVHTEYFWKEVPDPTVLWQYVFVHRGSGLEATSSKGNLTSPAWHLMTASWMKFRWPTFW